MEKNLKEKTKLRCNDSPHKEDIGKIFEYENIIDKEKEHKKMKQITSKTNSSKAPGWFAEWVYENKKEEMLYREQEHIKQEKFKEDIFNEIRGIKKDVCELKEKVDILEKDINNLRKDVHDIKEDIDNIVEKNKLKR
ncbi:MAG: hypothetical protein Ta2E_07190 [Mycoplasmoidaceae bacterium]|nr:MAG: hypothetical protein Ta2E_07190 [Mycoplasmoidaceae bacterium]